MRLNWFSPLPPERTDIGHYTARIAAALHKHFDVVFWTVNPPSLETLPPGVKVELYDPERIGEVQTRQKLFEGVNIYNMGNDARYHAAIYKVLKKVPGIVILHDTKLHHFIYEGHARKQDYVEIARHHYGESGALHATAVVKGRETIDQNVADMPFTEAVLDNALGVICHSKNVRGEIAACTTIPVLDLPLPFSSLAAVPDVVRIWEPPFKLIMFGFLGTNRRLEEVLRALAEHESRDFFRLAIYGTLWNETHIRGLIQELGLEALVEVHGYVPESELDAAISASHLAFNLRYPTMGEASGGILRSWSCATPTLVTAEGWYKDLPDEIAYKVSLANEVNDIQAALTQLLQDPDRFAKYGGQGRAFVRRNHDPENYVLGLKKALIDINDLEVRWAAHAMIRSIASKFVEGERRFFLGQAADKIAAILGS